MAASEKTEIRWRKNTRETKKKREKREKRKKRKKKREKKREEEREEERETKERRAALSIADNGSQRELASLRKSLT